MREKLKKLIDLLFNKSSYISFIGIILLSLIDISNWNESKMTIGNFNNFPIGSFFYWFVVIISVIFGFISIRHTENIEGLESKIIEKGNKIIDLENKLSDLVGDSNDLFNSYLKILIRNLEFSHNERISVYKCFNNKFKLIGRTSVNPILMEQGRSEYPIEEGFIGKGWKEGMFFVDDLPDPTRISTYYAKVKSIADIEKIVVENLKMKSRTMFVYRLDGFDSNPKAIIVFESEKEKAFEKDFIIEKINGVMQPLIMFIEKNNGVKIIENVLNL